MNSDVVRLDRSILLTMNKHRLQYLLFFILHMPKMTEVNLNYIMIDQHKLLTVFRRVLCEIQRKQSSFLTFKN